MVQPVARTTSRDLGADIVVGLCGFITSLFTAALLWWVEVQFGVALYTWMFWFIIPVGAVLSGFAGATGYYIGAWFSGYRPSSRLLLNIVIASITTFLLVHYFSYQTLQIDNKYVSDFLPFTQYLDVAIRSTSMDLHFRAAKAGSTGELGWLGYIVALLQVGGFAVGGFVVYAYLASKPYCENCSCYLKETGRQERFSSDGEILTGKIKTFAELLGERQFKSAIQFHSEKMGVIHSPGQRFRARLSITECPRCRINHLQFSVSKLEEQNWKDISDAEIRMFVSEQLDTVDPA